MEPMGCKKRFGISNARGAGRSSSSKEYNPLPIENHSGLVEKNYVAAGFRSE
jgi:hypothetical protein